MPKDVDLLPGTLDLLILKAVSLGPQHGYGVLLRIEQISGGALSIEQGALYPALYRIERQGLLKAKWGVSDNNRKAKFYELTSALVPSVFRKRQQVGTGWSPPCGSHSTLSHSTLKSQGHDNELSQNPLQWPVPAYTHGIRDGAGT
jgi:PadR family transcriptional regulator, regulatory protein PadR